MPSAFGAPTTKASRVTLTKNDDAANPTMPSAAALPAPSTHSWRRRRAARSSRQQDSAYMETYISCTPPYPFTTSWKVTSDDTRFMPT